MPQFTDINSNNCKPEEEGEEEEEKAKAKVAPDSVIRIADDRMSWWAGAMAMPDAWGSRGKWLGECGEKFVKVVSAAQGAGRV